MTKALRLHAPVRLVIAALAVLLAVIATPSAASAHTDFDRSDPADQEIVDGPLAEIAVDFTNPATASGEGFRLLGPSGTIVEPTSLDATDGTRFVLRFDPPLTAGVYGVRWEVQAGDAHPIDGSFQFTVVEAVPVTTVPDTTAPPAVATAATDTTEPPIASPTPIDATTDAELEGFLNGGSATDEATPVGRAGRALTFLGTIFGVGALAALLWVIRGRRDELRNLLSWIRLAGLAVGVGGLVELAALQSASALGVTALVDTRAGVAAVLKIIGGLCVWFGIHERVGQLVGPQPSLSAAVAADLPTTATRARPVAASDAHRWTPNSTATVGLAGYALILVSFWFDGHTVSKGLWAVHSLLNLVHLGAAAVWGGGVFAMTTVAWMRHRRSERAGLAEMVVRFSSLASVSLVTVIVAGLTMTFMIIDGPGELFTTAWGQVLIAKTMIVAVAAGIGGFNHFRLKPALEANPDDPGLARHLRRSLTIESVVFAAIAVITAFLVAAAT